MAQLRHAQTSALIAEGTPLELALIADSIGADRVVFDDVGVSFDAALVIAQHDETVAGLKGAAAAAKPGSTERTDLEAALEAATPDRGALDELTVDVDRRLELADAGNTDLAQIT